VDGGYGTFLGVDQEDGNAVGGLDGQEKAGAVGDAGVAAARIGTAGVKKVYYVGVDLFKGHERETAGAYGGLEAATVFLDVIAGIPIGETEIEDFFVFEVADAAEAGAEGVDQPGEFGEGGSLEKFEATRGAGGPAGRGDGWDAG
jgi:hypothetical protein